jgi:hypothetical protein
VADQKGSGAVAVGRGLEVKRAKVMWWHEVKARQALLDFAVHRLKDDLFLELMDMMR